MQRRNSYLLLIVFLAVMAEQNSARAQFSVSGYLQGMPVLIAAELAEPGDTRTLWEYRLQNRLNINWRPSSNVAFNWEMRTRLFAGDLVKTFPSYADAIDADAGLVDLSYLLVRQDDWLLHYIPDRIFGEWFNDDWSVRVGRQRINWGINMMTNPNDLFNLYSFYDFDYPERPGTDAIRIQRFLGFASRWEAAVSPGRDAGSSVAAVLYGFNTRGYDLQAIAGYYHDRLALGGGWAGSVGQAGFKGETMFFGAGNGETTNLVAALSTDYMFGNGLFLVAEGLYNLKGGQDQFSLLGEGLSPDNPSFSRYQMTTNLSYPFNPILTGSMAGVWYPDEEAVFVSPSASLSVAENLDLRVLAQFFAGSAQSAFSNAGTVVAASLKWNF